MENSAFLCWYQRWFLEISSGVGGDSTPDRNWEGIALRWRLVEGNQNVWQMGYSGAEEKQLREVLPLWGVTQGWTHRPEPLRNEGRQWQRI